MGSPADGKHMSNKLKQMKFMQRSADRARADAELKVERRQIDESHWRATYADNVVDESRPRTQVVYETSYLRMPGGDTAVRSNGAVSGSSSASVAVGRRSFKSFNAQVEEESRAAEAQQRDQYTEQIESRMTVDDETMAEALSKRP
ncbi:hypothetical protein H4R19_004826 [Coemansia spiralis]|nr:hypothetical protein H4R19_004826 [Coemansia spiralis]